MEDYLLCHAAFVMPAAFACYKTDGDLKKLRRNTVYLGRVIDANIEGYRAIRNAGHDILPKADADFESEKYRKTCLRFFKLMCATSLGKLCASDHAMNAIDEMSALNRDIKQFFDENGAAYPCGRRWRRRPGDTYDEIRRNAFRHVDAVCTVLPKPADSGVRLRYEYGKSHHEKSNAEIQGDHLRAARI